MPFAFASSHREAFASWDGLCMPILPLLTLECRVTEIVTIHGDFTAGHSIVRVLPFLTRARCRTRLRTQTDHHRESQRVSECSFNSGCLRNERDEPEIRIDTWNQGHLTIRTNDSLARSKGTHSALACAHILFTPVLCEQLAVSL